MIALVTVLSDKDWSLLGLNKNNTKFAIIAIMMSIMTILRIVICFQRKQEGTIKRFGACIGLCWGWKKEQTPSIPNKSSMINTQQHKYNEVQPVTTIKLFHGKLVAVNPLHTIVFGVVRHQTVLQSKMALAPSWFLRIQMPARECCCKKCNSCKTNATHRQTSDSNNCSNNK